MFCCNIFTADNGLSLEPKTDILMALQISILKEHFKPQLYLAEMANLSLSLSIGARSMALKFMGYNDSLENFIAEFFKAWGNFKPEDYKGMFEDKIQKVKQDYDNFNKKEPW